MVIAVSPTCAVGFAPVEARSKLMKGILAALAALIEALIAAESSARHDNVDALVDKILNVRLLAR